MLLPEKYLNCRRYMDFINQCRLKNYDSELVVHKHHIVPKHDGGRKIPDSINLVRLSVDDHIQAHLILYEEFGNFKDLTSANYLIEQWSDKKLKEKIQEYWNDPKVKREQSDRTKKYYSSLSPAKKKKFAEKVSTGQRNRSEEKKKITSEKMRRIRTESYSSWSEEKKEKFKEKLRGKTRPLEIIEKVKKTLANRTENQKQAQYKKSIETRILRGNLNCMSDELRSKNGYKAWETRRKNGTTYKQKSAKEYQEIFQKNLETKKKNGTLKAKRDPEKQRLGGKKSWETKLKNGWIDPITPQQRKDALKKNWETRRKNKISKLLTSILDYHHQRSTIYSDFSSESP